MSPLKPETCFTKTEDFWIGLHDQDVEGQWKWSDNSPVVAYNWDVGEPNDYNNYEDCVQVKGFTILEYLFTVPMRGDEGQSGEG